MAASLRFLRPALTSPASLKITTAKSTSSKHIPPRRRPTNKRLERFAIFGVEAPIRAVARPPSQTYLVVGLPGTAGWPICRSCWIICIRCWYICCNCWLIACGFITAGGGTGKVGGMLVCSGCPNGGGADRSGWFDKDAVEESVGGGEGGGVDGSGCVVPFGELTAATVFSGCTGAGGSGGAGSSCLGGGAEALE